MIFEVDWFQSLAVWVIMKDHGVYWWRQWRHIRDTSRNEIEEFLLTANNFHPTIKFTAEISETETTFLDTKVYKKVRFNKDSILDTRTHFKPTETFQYTNFCSCHQPGVTKGFVKGDALRLLRTNSSEIIFEENTRNKKKERIEITQLQQEKNISQRSFSETERKH